jgi:hypothetical protein
VVNTFFAHSYILELVVAVIVATLSAGVLFFREIFAGRDMLGSGYDPNNIVENPSGLIRE